MSCAEAASIQQFLITASISKAYLSEESHNVQVVKEFIYGIYTHPELHSCANFHTHTHIHAENMARAHKCSPFSMFSPKATAALSLL